MKARYEQAMKRPERNKLPSEGELVVWSTKGEQPIVFSVYGQTDCTIDVHFAFRLIYARSVSKDSLTSKPLQFAWNLVGAAPASGIGEEHENGLGGH
eukprot:3123182-Amphidinium_carterae.2